MIATAPVVRTSPLDQLLQEEGALAMVDKMTKAEFIRFAAEHEEFQMERDSDGTVIIMPLVLGGSGKRENLMGYFVRHWQIQTGLGEVYGSTTGFNLPDGSTRAPDTAWISDERLLNMSAEEEENSFIPVVPDFVVEVLSSSDRLVRAKDKMQNTWMANGVLLGWLIDPYREEVHIYRAGREVEILSGFMGKTLSGEAVLPGLEVPLDKLLPTGK